VIPSPERCRGGQAKFARDRFEVLPALQPGNRRKLAIRRPTDSLTRKRLRSVRLRFQNLLSPSTQSRTDADELVRESTNPAPKLNCIEIR
jgi:hypothetical protein